jgi:hypothetical protein
MTPAGVTRSNAPGVGAIEPRLDQLDTPAAARRRSRRAAARRPPAGERPRQDRRGERSAQGRRADAAFA